MATTTTRTKSINDVPPMRRTCEHWDHGYSDQVGVTAFVIDMSNPRSTAIGGGMYVCPDHAVELERFVSTFVTQAPCSEYRPIDSASGLNGTPFCACGFERRQH